MPADYEACRDSLIKKGVSDKTAKRRCAIWFYKKHGYTVNEAHKKARGEIPEEPILGDEDWESMKLMTANLEDIKEKVKSTKPSTTSIGETERVEAINMDFLEDYGIVEIVATRVGATAFTSTGVAVTWTDKALSKSAGTWKFGNVSINHNGENYGKIIDSFYENECLKQVIKVNDKLKGWLKEFGKAVGVSTEASKVRINKALEIIASTGTGVTFVFPPESPACKNKEGCGIVGTETIEDNTERKDEKQEEETEIDGVVSSKATSPWVDIDDTTGGSIPFEIEWTSTTNETVAPNNITEENKNSAETPKDNVSVEKKEEKVDNMVEENKTETVCAKEHESKMKAKDSEIEALKGEMETLKATVAKFEAEKKARVLETFVKETGLEAKDYESKDISVLEDIMATLKVLKEKEDREPEVNSGAEVKATEQDNKKEGDIVSATIAEAEQKAKDEADAITEMIAKLNAKATEMDGVKR